MRIIRYCEHRYLCLRINMNEEMILLADIKVEVSRGIFQSRTAVLKMDTWRTRRHNHEENR